MCKTFDMRRLAGMLLFCALLMRGMIPAGYMPNFNPDDGQGLLVICSSAGERLLPTDDGKPVPAVAHHDQLCAFAMASAWAPVLLFVLLLVVPLARRSRYRLPQLLPGEPLWLCRPPAARGPPLAV